MYAKSLLMPTHLPQRTRREIDIIANDFASSEIEVDSTRKKKMFSSAKIYAIGSEKNVKNQLLIYY
jgi:hypothetical protein